MALELTTPAEAIDEAAVLFTGLVTDAPDLPTFPEPPEIDIEEVGTLPTDLTTEIAIPTLAELTEGAAGADGVFDKLMSSVDAHITSQYHKGVFGTSDVSQIYAAAVQATLQQAIAFLLQGPQNFWQAKLVQVQTQNLWLERARLNAELQTARLVAFKAQADAATAQMNAFTARTQYANQKLQLVATLQTVNNGETQEAIQQAQYDAAYVQTHSLLPGGATPGGIVAKDLELKDEQITLTQNQQTLVQAQANVQRAQTYDTNTDLTAVTGVIGVQKNLYEQQIQSYIDDGKNKGVKVMADLWTSAKALDDAVEQPGPLATNLMLASNTYLNDLGLPNAMFSIDTPGTGTPSDDDDLLTPGQQ